MDKKRLENIFDKTKIKYPQLTVGSFRIKVFDSKDSDIKSETIKYINNYLMYLRLSPPEDSFDKFLKWFKDTYVEIIIRPQHLKIDFDRSGKGPNATIKDCDPARGKVWMSRFVGKESIIELKMEKDGSKLKASIQGFFFAWPRNPIMVIYEKRPLFCIPEKYIIKIFNSYQYVYFFFC